MLTRRQALATGSPVAVGPGGYLGGDGPVAVDAFEYELVNNDDQARVFNYAVETTDGLGAWTTSEVPANDTRSSATARSTSKRAPTVHCVVDATRVRQGSRVLQ